MNAPDPLDVQRAPDAEVSLLGAAMSGYPDVDDLLDLVEARDFYDPTHGQVWEAIARVHRAGSQPDPVSVRVALDESRTRYDPASLLSMTSMVPLVAQAPYYARQVAEAAGMREIQRAGTRLHHLGSTPGDLEERREQARQAVDEACRGRSVSRARTLADIMSAVVDAAQTGKSAALGTPWPDIDRMLGGLAPGRLVVIGARPGVGKTIAGCNLALHFASAHRHAVLMASLEMPEAEIGQRLLAAYANVDLASLQAAAVPEVEWDRIAARLTDLSALPLTVDDAANQTVAGIRRSARDIQRRRDDLALIVVDYLQLVRPVDSRANRAEQVTEISRSLKLLARETGACVVAMAQVNREGAKADGGPRLVDIREGGAENDADQVLLLHQPSEETPEIEVDVAKNRHGPRGKAELYMQGHYARLGSVAWQPTRGIA